MKNFYLAIVSLVAMSLSGCSMIPQPTPLSLYNLPAERIDTQQGELLDTRLRVSEPQAIEVLDSARISVQPGNHEHRYYSEVRWTDRVPILVRQRLMDAFWESGRIAGLSTDEQHLPADYELLSNLRAFQTEYHQGQPVVRVELEISLVALNGRDIVASTRIQVAEPSSGEDIPSVVSTFGRAMDELSQQVVNWTLAQLAKVDAD